MELYLDNEGLVNEEIWVDEILHIQKLVGEGDRERLKQALISAIKKRLPGKRFGIFFSGGIDSSFIAMICKKLDVDFICYTVGFQESGMEVPPDIIAAEKIAKESGFELRKKVFSLKEAEEIIKITKEVVPLKDSVSVGVGAVVVGAGLLAKEDGVDILFSGLGSEEIFAGYQRHAEALDVQEECWKGLQGMWKRDLVRDITLSEMLGISILTPFLDESVIKEAMSIKDEKKINKEYKKIILREIAEELGLPKEFAWRKKKAAQYGSKFDRALAKLASKEGLEKGEFAKLS